MRFVASEGGRRDRALAIRVHRHGGGPRSIEQVFFSLSLRVFANISVLGDILVF